jgi:hypothetical protein
VGLPGRTVGRWISNSPLQTTTPPHLHMYLPISQPSVCLNSIFPSPENKFPSYITCHIAQRYYLQHSTPLAPPRSVTPSHLSIDWARILHAPGTLPRPQASATDDACQSLTRRGKPILVCRTRAILTGSLTCTLSRLAIGKFGSEYKCT